MFSPPGGGTTLVMSKPLPGMPDTIVGGASKIAWETDNIEALYETLRSKGVEFPQPPTRRFWGGIEAQFQDADGNVFMLHQE